MTETDYWKIDLNIGQVWVSKTVENKWQFFCSTVDDYHCWGKADSFEAAKTSVIWNYQRLLRNLMHDAQESLKILEAETNENKR